MSKRPKGSRRRRVGRLQHHSSWLENVARRAQLTQPARNAYPDFTHRRRQSPSGVVYSFSATVPLEGFEARHVTVLFRAGNPSSPIVLADGPEDSPHRYSRRRLCLWFPDDPAELRWVPDDGLLGLFGMAMMHLIKEAWWRETGRWVGQEYPHDEVHQKQPEQAA